MLDLSDVLIAAAYAYAARLHSRHDQDCTAPAAIAAIYAWHVWLKLCPLAV